MALQTPNTAWFDPNTNYSMAGTGWKDAKKVVILGAGLAGLAAGYTLSAASQAVLVLEADSTVGGLAKTIRHHGFRFDLGGHRFFTTNKRVDQFVKDVLNQDFLVVPRKSKIYLFNRYFDYCNDFEYTYTFSKRMPCGLSSKLINTFVLLQFDIEIGSMFPCLRISFSVCTLLSTLVTLIVCDCRTNIFISSSFTTLIQIEKRIENRSIYRKAKPLSMQYASYHVGHI